MGIAPATNRHSTQTSARTAALEWNSDDIQSKQNAKSACAHIDAPQALADVPSTVCRGLMQATATKRLMAQISPPETPHLTPTERDERERRIGAVAFIDQFAMHQPMTR